MTTLLAVIKSLVRHETPGRTVSWNDLVVHRNVAPLPTPRPGPDTIWIRGFDFLVLGAAGRPSHFGRCRPGHDARARRASDIRSRLSGAPDLAGLIPRTRCGDFETMLVEISDYVSGTLLAMEIARFDAATFAGHARGTVAAVRQIASHAERHIASLHCGDAALDLGEAAAPALRFLSQAGLASRRADALARALAAGGSVPCRIQHGDLWPGNVLRCGDRLVVLDFEVFGEVRVPLYDTLHFLQSCLLQRRGTSDGATFLDLLGAGSADADVCRQILREESVRDTLTRVQVVAVTAFYFVEMTARFKGRETPYSFWGPYWRGLEVLADLLSAGSAADELLLGPAPPR